jgi:hypothetical protein
MASSTALSFRNRRASVISEIEEYLFRPGGAYAIGICRIGLFLYLYLHVLDESKYFFGKGAKIYFNTVNLSAYYPKSIVWLLFPHAPPPIAVVDLFFWVASTATVMALIGFFTRVAMIASVISLVFLGSLIFSWEPLWSHPYNSGLIAGLAFMFGRAGDTLSVDCLIARMRGRPYDLNRDVYWWPVILGQFGVAAVYFGGFYAKWSTPDFSYDFSWVFSDNLRNSVSLPWLIRGEELPWNVDLIVNNPIIWKISAAGHLATQGLPILALFSLNRPWIRLFEGGVFVFGVVMLKWVMGMWNPEWMILAVFFVDWEYFLQRIGASLRYGPIPEAATNLKRLAVSSFAIAFAALNLFIIAFRLDDNGWNRLYPFSSMNFYSNVAARKPYDQHQHYPFTYGQIVLSYSDGTTSDWHCAPARASSYVVTFSNGSDSIAKAEQQAGSVAALVRTLKPFDGAPFVDCDQHSIVRRDIEAVDLYSSILNIPPYPERVKFEIGHRALVGRYERAKDRIIAASVSMADGPQGRSFKVANKGLDVDRYEILVSNDPWVNYKVGPLMAPKGMWKDNVFTIGREELEALPSGWLPFVIRVHERDGSLYDFFGGIIYK